MNRISNIADPDFTAAAPTTVTELLLKQARERPNAIALGFLDTRATAAEATELTYAELLHQVRGAAAKLSLLEPAPSTLLVAMPTSREAVITFLGAMVAGLRPAMMPPPRPGKRHHAERILQLERIEETIGDTLIAVTREGASTLHGTKLEPRLLVLEDWLARDAPEAATLPEARPGDVACLQFTSGSTRQPRGVALTHANILANMGDISAAYGLRANARVLGWLPLHHDMGLFGHVLQPLYAGATGYLAPPEWFMRDPLAWLRAISDLKVYGSGAPPFAYELLLRTLSGKTEAHADIDLSCLSVLYIGAEPVRAPFLRMIADTFEMLRLKRSALFPCYGLAETVLFAGGRHFADDPSGTVPYDLAASTVAKIIDPDTLAPVGLGDTGEILLAGPSVTSGFYRGAPENDRAFVEMEGQRFLRTGDLGQLNGRTLSVTGRLNNRLKYNGVTYHAEDIEQIVKSAVPDLSRNAVAAIAAPGRTHEGIVIVAEARADAEGANALRLQINAALSEALDCTATQIEIVRPASLPRTSSGKLRHRQIADALRGGTLTKAARSVPKPSKAVTSTEPPTSRVKEIAIVGMACRFPGADSPDAFWQRLLNGDDLITQIPATRWDVDRFYSPDPATPGMMNSRFGGFLDDFDQFDPAFFGISDPEAAQMDPQQRLALEVSWRAFEDAGLAGDTLKGSNTGVFVGISTSDYVHLQIHERQDMSEISAWTGLGTSPSISANRISYVHDLRGPSVAMDTACSSSLTAVHTAIRALQNGDCDAAVAGGVGLIMAPSTSVTLAQFGMLASDGRCKVFDASADGYVRSEGCGFVVLKPLDQALADGDRIHAVIRGSAAAQDGRSPGITAPNMQAQRDLIHRALRSANQDPVSVGYIEAHGTGTAAGDPAEVLALHDIYGRIPGYRCWLGGVKANVGHLEAAAGIAGLIKTILVLRHHKVPKQIHFEELPQDVAIKGGRLGIPKATSDWTAPNGQPRVAALSSFGFGGALVHMILQEAPAAPIGSPNPSGHPVLLPLSAHSAEALDQHRRAVQAYCDTHQHGSVAAVARSLGLHRPHLRHRTFAIASSMGEASAKMVAQNPTAFARPSFSKPSVGFLFSGQGRHKAQQGKALAQRFAVFQRALDEAASALAVAAPDAPDLHDILFSADDRRLREPALGQPALVALSYALDQLIRSFGIAPVAVAGHSMGEIAASVSAGIFDIKQAISFAHQRGALMAQLDEPGAMIAAACSADQAQGLIDYWNLPGLCIAAFNARGSVSLSGPLSAIETALQNFKSARIAAKRLSTALGFHSAVLDPMLDDLQDTAAMLDGRDPSVTLISTVTGSLCETAPDAAYWRAHAREPVRFAQTCTVMADLGVTHFLEIGPGDVLTGLARVNLPGTQALPLLPDGQDEAISALWAAGTLYEQGHDLNWQGIESLADGEAAQTRPDLNVPGQPFVRKRYWYDMEFSSVGASSAPSDTPDAWIEAWTEVETWAEAPSSPGILDDSLRNWLIIGDADGLADTLAAQIASAGRPVFHLTRTSGKRKDWATWRGALRRIVKIALPDRFDGPALGDVLIDILTRKVTAEATRWSILFLAPLDIPSGSRHERHQLINGFGLLSTVMAAFRPAGLTGQMSLVTRGAVPALPGAAVEPDQAAIWGFGTTLFLEHPDLRGGMIDVDGSADVADMAQDLLRLCSDPALPGTVALRDRVLLRAQLQPASTPEIKSVRPVKDGLYLITGGLGGLGLATAKWLAKAGAGHIVLMSRSATEEARKTHRAAIEELETLGAKLHLIACDLANPDALRSALKTIAARDVPLRGIFHAAGQNWLGRVAETSPDDMMGMMRIKAGAAQVLHDETQNAPLDYFVTYSSVAALWGSAELAHYSASNRYLDGLATLRASQGLPATSVQWGPWADVGMSAKAREIDVVTRAGLPLIPVEQALQAMEEAIQSNDPVRLVAIFDWPRFKAFADYSINPSLFDLARIDRHRTAITKDAKEFAAELAKLPRADAHAKVCDLLHQELAALVYLQPGEGIGLHDRFNMLGIDSLTAISFPLRLEARTGIALSPTLAYTHPTIAEASEFILEQILARPNSTPDPSMADRGAGAWFDPIQPGAQPTLLALPYAGAASTVFSDWPEWVTGADMRAVELPGRGYRHAEQMASSVNILAEALSEEIRRTGGIDILFGHSFGARIAFETAKHLSGSDHAPKALILSALGPTPLSLDGTPLHMLGEPHLAEMFARWYGTDPTAPDHSELWRKMAPGLAHDLALLDACGAATGKLDIPIAVLGGRDDPLAPPETLLNWRQHTTQGFSLDLVSGAHMPFRDDPAAYFAALNRLITSGLAPR